jgi:hypothetical protein
MHAAEDSLVNKMWPPKRRYAAHACLIVSSLPLKSCLLKLPTCHKGKEPQGYCIGRAIGRGFNTRWTASTSKLTQS